MQHTNLQKPSVSVQNFPHCETKEGQTKVSSLVIAKVRK